METIKEKIRGKKEWMICLCKNTPMYEGFYTSDIKGNYVEPSIGSTWAGLYRCGNCGRIIHSQTLEITKNMAS